MINNNITNRILLKLKEKLKNLINAKYNLEGVKVGFLKYLHENKSSLAA